MSSEELAKEKSESASNEQTTESRNFIKLLISQFLTNLGDAIINPKVTLPWILQSIGAPAYLMGWLVPIRESGSLLPQLAIASFMRRLAIRKWVWVAGSVIQSLSILAIGLFAINFQGALAGWLIVANLVVFSLARGLCSVASKDVLGKTIPKKRRGRVTGWSASVAGLVTVGIAGVMVLTAFTQYEPSALSYGLCLLVAAVVWLMAAFVYSGVDEPSGEVDEGKNAFKQAIQQMSLLKTDRAFRHFVIVRSLFLCTALTAPYYVLLAQQTLGSQLWVLALFVLASGLASLISGPFWGIFSDYSSRKVMMTACLGSAIVGFVLFAVNALHPEWLGQALMLPCLYFLLTIAHQGVRVGRKIYLVNLGEGNKRTSYVAVSNTVIGIMLLVMSLLGVLTQLISLPGLILVFSFMAILGVLLALRLPEV